MQSYPGELIILCQFLSCVIYTGFANLRFNKKCTAAIAAVFLVLKYTLNFSNLILWVYMLPGNAFWNRFLGTMMVFVVYVLPMYAYVVLTTKEEWREHLMLFLQIFAMAEFLEAFTWLVSDILSIGIHFKKELYMELIAGALLVLLAVALFLAKRKQKHVVIAWKEHKGMVWTAALVTLMCFVLFNFWQLLFYYTTSDNPVLTSIFNTSIMAAGTFVYFCAVLATSLIRKNLRESQIQNEQQAIKDLLDLQYHQYLDYVENTDYLREQCHDLKHQIEAMRALPQSEMWGEYLDELENAVKKYDTWNVTGNMVLDALLTKKKQQCNKRNIQLTCKCNSCNLDFMPTKDICSIFGNILDNAMEAVTLIEEDRRVIHGEIGQKEQFLLIRFENCCNREVLKFASDTNLPSTTKEEKHMHGIGLKNIEQIVKKYDGVLKVKKENGWFHVGIMIPLK